MINMSAKRALAAKRVAVLKEVRLQVVGVWGREHLLQLSNELLDVRALMAREMKTSWQIIDYIITYVQSKRAHL